MKKALLSVVTAIVVAVMFIPTFAFASDEEEGSIDSCHHIRKG